MAFPPVAGPAARTRRSEARGPWERELYRVTTPQKDVCDLTQTCRRGHDAVGNHLGAVLRRTRRVDGVEVDVHCARRRPSSAQRNDVDRSCPRDTPAPCEAAPGVRERGDGVQATAGVRRGAPRRGGRAPAPFSELHQSRSAPGPDAVRIHSNSKKKRAPTTSDRHDARRYHDDGVEAEGADFDAGFWPERLLFAPARDDVITKTASPRVKFKSNVHAASAPGARRSPRTCGARGRRSLIPTRAPRRAAAGSRPCYPSPPR